MFKLLFFISIMPLFVFGQTTFTLSKAKQTELYSKVITEYIKAVNKKDTLRYDTLYIGKHIEFPEINLPDTIEGKEIILLTYREGDKKPQNRRAFVLINIIEWKSTKDKMEFMIVTFYKEYHPKHNCYVDLKYDPAKKQFELQKEIRFDYECYPKIK